MCLKFKKHQFKIRSQQINIMGYKFTFDFTKLSQTFFREIAKTAEKTRIHRKIKTGAISLVKNFKISEITGLDVSNLIEVVTDLVDIQIKNMVHREDFLNSKKRVLFLPQCLRKHTHGTCKAVFKPEIPSHFCSNCSVDCLVNQATKLGKQNGYDVYIVDGGSCIPKILKQNSYDAVVGVACPEELKLAAQQLEKTGIPGQGVPLIKNGCVYTSFNIDSLKNVL